MDLSFSGLAFVFVVIVVGLYMGRHKNGWFRVQLSDYEDILTTELGRMRFVRSEGRIYVERKNGLNAWVALGDVLGAQSRVSTRLVRPDDSSILKIITTKREDYDHEMTWSIVLVTHNGLVPVSSVTEHQSNSWWSFSIFASHNDPGRSWGSKKADEILDAVNGLLRRAGLDGRGGHDYELPTAALDGAPLPHEPRAPKARPAPEPIELPPDDGPTHGAGAWPDSHGRNRR